MMGFILDDVWLSQVSGIPKCKQIQAAGISPSFYSYIKQMRQLGKGAKRDNIETEGRIAQLCMYLGRSYDDLLDLSEQFIKLATESFSNGN
jgi:hypothetical protein